MSKRGGTIEFAPVGDVLENGYDLGGSRIYPWSRGLAITPPSLYSDYLGSANGLPVNPPVAALTGTTGSPAGGAASRTSAIAAPFSKSSPLPWVLGGLVLAIVSMHLLHYRRK